MKTAKPCQHPPARPCQCPPAGPWRMILPVLLAFFVVAILPRPVSAAEAIVTDVRAGMNGGTTRLVFDLSNRVEFSIFSLTDPFRVVIDLPEVGWRLPARPLPGNIGMLDKLRYGLFKVGTSRIVIDVKSAPEVKKSFVLNPDGDNGYRLVVDINPAGDITKAMSPPPLKAQPQPDATQVGFAAPPRKPDGLAPGPVKRVVVIDPGHGGVDPGTIGVSGTYEKHITLAMAQDLKKQLERTGKFTVFLTRSRDIFVQLRDRVSRARDAGADLFISVHADAIKNKKTRGLSVYTLSEKASDKEAAQLAEKENKADLIAGINLVGETPEVTNILIDLAQRESMNQSSKFASGLVKELGRQTKMLRNTHRFAGFAVLKAPDVPSVLIELGFLSNRADEKALRSQNYRIKLATGISRAITAYFSNIEEAYRK